MKFIIASLILMSASAFAHETETCWGGPYWALMEKSQRICNHKAQLFETKTGLTCTLRTHNDPNVCWSNCKDENGTLKAKLRVDMTSNCNSGDVWFYKTKVTWYR